MRSNPLLRILLAGGTLCWLTGAAAVAQVPSPQQPSMGAPGRSGAPGSNSPMSERVPGTNTDTTETRHKVDDRRFVRDAAINGLTEVELGKLAADKGSTDAVKESGRKLVDEHTKTNEELKKLALAQSLNVPESLDKKRQAQVDKMAKLNGPNFDRAYIKEQLKQQERDVRDFKDEAQNGNDPVVRNFASKALPSLQQHVAALKDLSKNKAGSTSADRSR